MILTFKVSKKVLQRHGTKKKKGGGGSRSETIETPGYVIESILASLQDKEAQVGG